MITDIDGRELNDYDEITLVVEGYDYHYDAYPLGTRCKIQYIIDEDLIEVRFLDGNLSHVRPKHCRKVG